MGNKELTEKIQELLAEMQILKRRKGYQYILEAIRLAYRDKRYLHSKYSLLYPELANRFGVTAMSVEKAIRDCIKSSWGNIDKEVIKKILKKNKVKNPNGPSNSKFFCTVVDYLKLEEN